MNLHQINTTKKIFHHIVQHIVFQYITLVEDLRILQCLQIFDYQSVTLYNWKIIIYNTDNQYYIRDILGKYAYIHYLIE